MKSIVSNDVIESINGVRLFRDDLDQIVNYFEKRTLHLTISDSINSYESLAEVAEHRGNRPARLSFRGTGADSFPSIVINFERSEARLHSHFSSDLRSFAYELKDFLSRRVPWDYKVFNPWIWWAVFWCFQLSVLVLFPPSTQVITLPAWVWRLSILLLFIWLFCLAHRRLNFGLHLTRKHETGFFRRNADRVILLLIGSVLGIGLTYFVQ